MGSPLIVGVRVRHVGPLLQGYRTDLAKAPDGKPWGGPTPVYIHPGDEARIGSLTLIETKIELRLAVDAVDAEREGDKAMLKFKEGDRIRATARAPRGNGGKTGAVLWIEVDDELRDPFYTVLLDDGVRALLAEGDLDSEDGSVRGGWTPSQDVEPEQAPF